MSKKYITDYIDVNGGTQTTAPRNTISDYAIFVSAVQGTGYYKGILGIGESANGINAGILAYDGGTGGQQDLVFVTSNDIFSAPVEAMRIDSSGNTTIKGLVGIGTNPISSNLLNMQFDNTDPNADFYFAQRIDGNFSGADNTTGDREQGGIFLDIDSSADGDAGNEHRLYGVYSDVRHTGFSDLVYSGYFRAENNNSTEKTSTLSGIQSIAVHDSGVNGGVSQMMGLYATSSVEDAGDVDNAYGGYFLTASATTRTADVGNLIGLRGEVQFDSPVALNYGVVYGVQSVIDNNEGSLPSGTNSYLFYGEYQGTRYATNSWGLYVAGDKHYLEGNVGISTASPSAKLQIGAGTSNTSNRSDVAILSGSNTGGLVDGLSLVNSANATFGNGVALNFHNGNAYSPTGAIRTYQVPAGIITDSYMSFYTYKSGLNERMRIDALGNVGIGTTDPNQKLEIRDEAPFLRITSTLNDDLHQAGREYGGIEWYTEEVYGSAPVTTAYVKAIHTRAGTGHSNADAGLVFATSTASSDATAVERMRIESATGYVGIGTDSPSAHFEIKGSDSANALSITDSGGGAGIRATVHSTQGTYIQLYDGGGTQTIQLDARTDNTNRDCYFNMGGNFGIGSTDPISKLTIEGARNTPILTLRSTSNDSSWSTGDRIGGIDFYSNDASGAGAGVKASISYESISSSSATNHMVFKVANTSAGTNNQEAMRIDNSGSIGIGTDNITEKLTIAGSVKADSFGVEESTYTRILAPAGASLNVNSSSVTGRLTVVLPQAGLSSMLKFTIRVFDYNYRESFDVFVAGYAYSTSNWTRQTAYIISEAGTDRNFSVRFGYTPTGKAYVSIGELTSTWSYPKFSVIDAEIAHSGTSLDKWIDGWDCIVVSDDTGYTVNQTVTNTQVTNWKRNGQDLYYGSGTGKVGIGTTSPSGKLDVNGQIVLSSDTEHYIEKDTTSLVTGSAVETTTISGRNIDLYAYDDVNLRAGTGDKITFHAGGGEKMRIDGSGRVIIGATSPANSSYKISVSNSNGGFVSNASGAGDASFYSTSSTIGWHFYGDNGTTNTFHVTNAGQGYFAGNVGIGNTSPSYPLDVTGEGRFTTNIRVGQYIYHDGDTNTSIRLLGDRIILYAGGVNMIDVVEGGTDYIDFANNTARITSGGAFETTGDIIAYTTTSLSDENQKENIKKIDSPIEKIKQISGYTFDWKHSKVSSGGVIAQEVEKILPEIVKEKSIMDSEPHKTVEYNGLIGLLIETVKEQQEQIDELKRRLDGSTK